MVKAKSIDLDEFDVVLRYDREANEIFWKERPVRLGKQLEHLDRLWNERFANKPVARRVHKHGHFYIGHLGKNYAFHRLVWLLHFKENPPNGIDHINGNPQDNRIENLRAANQSENMSNTRIRSNNTSGVKGISWSKKSNAWYVYINKNKKMYALGMTPCFEEAKRIRKAAEERFHGEFARAA